MNTGHILLVDDDPALLQALPQAISLRMTGVQVQTAGEASIALRLLQEQEYDAIVSDIKMPGMDGLTLLNKIVAQHPETPVILITGHGEHDLAIRALRGGAYDYILKPIDRDDFAASLQRALHTRQLRRQIQVQQRALEWYALSLEQRVEERTHELVAINETKLDFVLCERLGDSIQTCPPGHIETEWHAFAQIVPAEEHQADWQRDKQHKPDNL